MATRLKCYSTANLCRVFSYLLVRIKSSRWNFF